MTKRTSKVCTEYQLQRKDKKGRWIWIKGTYFFNTHSDGEAKAVLKEQMKDALRHRKYQRRGRSVREDPRVQEVRLVKIITKVVSEQETQVLKEFKRKF